jgi:hypothetical protein
MLLRESEIKKGNVVHFSESEDSFCRKESINRDFLISKDYPFLKEQKKVLQLKSDKIWLRVQSSYDWHLCNFKGQGLLARFFGKTTLSNLWKNYLHSQSKAIWYINANVMRLTHLSGIHKKVWLSFRSEMRSVNFALILKIFIQWVRLFSACTCRSFSFENYSSATIWRLNVILIVFFVEYWTEHSCTNIYRNTLKLIKKEK